MAASSYIPVGRTSLVKRGDVDVQVQTEYAKTSYEGFVAKASKIGELYADLAKESYKPFESMFAKSK